MAVVSHLDRDETTLLEQELCDGIILELFPLKVGVRGAS
jgi:hypothetical protein